MSHPIRLVIDEWFLHHLSGNEGCKLQKQAGQFLVYLIEGKDSIAILHNGPWWKKMNSLKSSGDPLVKKLIKLLDLSIIWNQSKCEIIYPNESFQIPERLQDITPPDDIYLIETYLLSNSNLLITTDIPLYNNFKTIDEIKMVLREKFIADIS